jgi:hypothetical protein
MPVKLLMVTHYFESHRSGIELIAGRLIRELVRLQQEVVWVASNVTPPIDDKIGSRSVALSTVNITERYLGIPFPIPSPPGIFKFGARCGAPTRYYSRIVYIRRASSRSCLLVLRENRL